MTDLDKSKDGWRLSTWGEEIELKYGKAIRGYKGSDKPYPVYGTNGKVGTHTDYLTQGPGVILGRKGAYRGVHFSEEPFFVIDTAYYIKPTSEMDMRWLYYAMKYYKVGEIDDGSPIPSTTRAAVYTYDFWLPPVVEQNAISNALAVFDNKIEVNWRMNAVLEGMARAVFRDWFVDFGPTRRKMAGEGNPVKILGGAIRPPAQAQKTAALFPDRLGENGLPEGWVKRSFGDIITPRKGKTITRKTAIPEGIPVVAGGLKPAYYHNVANVNGPVITVSASGANAGFVRLYHENIWASDCSFIGLDQTDFVYSVYTLLSLRQSEIFSMQQGAAQPHIYPSDLMRLPIADPQENIWLACEELFTTIYGKISNALEENQTLAGMRDLLLPKLMSGEIRLREGG